MLRGQDAFHFYLSHEKSFKPHVDPELADNHSTHSDFLTRLRAAGMLRFRASPKNYGSLSLQLIMRFKEPPKSELLTASAVYFTLFCVPGNVYLGSGDIRIRILQFESPQCFSQLVHFLRL